MKKKLLWIVLVLLGLAVAAVVAVGLSLDKIIKRAVETAGPAITKVSVELDGVDLSLFSGQGALHGFRLGNPPGYPSPTSIQFDLASLALEPSSLLADKVVIRHIRLEAPVINVEGGLKGINLNDLMKGMQTAKKEADVTTPSSLEEEDGRQAASRKLQVDDFSITGGRVNLNIKELGGETRTLVLPDIKVSDLGTGPEGITARELSERVLSVVVRETLRVMAESDGDLDAISESGLKQLEDSGNQDAANAVRGALQLFKKDKP